MSDQNYNALKKDELVVLLSEKDHEIAELSKIAENALARLTISEKSKASGRKEVVIEAGKEGNFLFIGHGFRSKEHGLITADVLKEKPEIAVALSKGGCEFVKKI